LDWWAARCLEWCYARMENGKFGDQKYLDDWPTRFKGIHVLQHLGGGAAPWNIQKYKVSRGPRIDGVPVIFYHFHELAWLTNNRFYLGRYKLSAAAISLIYLPYLENLERSLMKVQTVQNDFRNGITEPKSDLKTQLKIIKRKLFGEYNVIQR
jgi:hypothetical protein